jgi:hypothetical protein
VLLETGLRNFHSNFERNEIKSEILVSVLIVVDDNGDYYYYYYYYYYYHHHHHQY